MIKSCLCLILLTLFTITYSSQDLNSFKKYPYDITIVGRIDFGDSLSRLTMAFIDMLSPNFKVNFISTSGYYIFQDASSVVKNVALNKDKRPGRIAFFTDILWTKYYDNSLKLPNSEIKIAYSMLEGTRIPNQWVNILNKKFNAVIVPDNYYIKVYKESGVKIPIFVLPCPMYLDELFKIKPKIKPNKVFTFGCSAAFWERKNHETLVTAFAQGFGNNPKFKLRLHGRQGEELPKIRQLIKNLNLKNVEIINQKLNYKSYIDFLYSLDCYVLISKGEGFSVTPREALALGIPCILSNNTAHKTICDTGLVCGVKSNIVSRAYYPLFGYSGFQYNCNIKDVVSAMNLVYKNYDIYILKSLKSKLWINNYSYVNLSKMLISILINLN